MKRLLLIILGLSIGLFLASCSVSETNEQLIDNSNTSQTANDTNSDNTVSPAKVIRFDSFQHMAQLKKYRENVDDTDNDIVWYEYMKKNYNGAVQTKEFVSKMFSDLDGLNMLLLDSSSGYNLEYVTYYGYGRKRIEYFYENEGKRIRIRCYLDPDGTVATEFAYRKKYDVADRIGFGDEEIILYYASKELVYSFCSCITTSNSLMDVWFYDDDISAAKEVIEKYAISTTLNELIA